MIVVVQFSKYYASVDRTMDATNMNYANVLSSFKIEWDTYEELKKEDDPDFPVINYK